MVANAPEGAQVVKSRAKIGWEIPMVAHWGISGGRFAELVALRPPDWERPGRHEEQGQITILSHLLSAAYPG